MWYCWKFGIRGDIWSVLLYSLTLSTSHFQLAWHRMTDEVTAALQTSSMTKGFPGGRSGEESICQSKICGFNFGVRKIPWRRAWQPLQYSCLENPMDRGAWWATVHSITKSQTQLNDLVNKQHDKGLQQMLQQNIQISEAWSLQMSLYMIDSL